MESILGPMFSTAIVFSVIFFIGKVFSSIARNNALSNPKDVKNNLKFGILAFKKNDYDEALKYLNNIDRDVDIQITIIAEYHKGFISLYKTKFTDSKNCFEFVINNLLEIENSTYSEYIAYTYFFYGFVYYLENNLSQAKIYKDISLDRNSSLKLNSEKTFEKYLEL